ncbi:gamma-glutamyltranspeptidase [Rhodobiaceae bacterium]|nr:gamma-glutamyltranspeptidase [Rhodobiaceae bacterium]
MLKKIGLSLLTLLAVLIFGALFVHQDFYWNKRAAVFEREGEVRGQNGMVVSAHALASQVGIDVLKQGGNAFDAAVAVQFALAVVYPQAGNIGGGGFLVYRQADGATGTLDYRERAPKSAHRDMYLDGEGNVVPGLSLTGPLAVGVPGTVDGMVEVHERFGTLPFAELVQPAITLASEGYVLTPKGAGSLNRFRNTFSKVNRFTPAALKDTPWAAGEEIAQPDLAATLTRIRDAGRAGFYEGTTAELIVDEMEAGGGLITREDLSDYRSVWRDPIIGTYRGHRIISMPPPSSGGIALVQLLKGVEAYDVAAMGHNSTDHIHLMTELARRVYADRATYLGDPDFVEVDIPRLTGEEFVSARMASIDMESATPSEDVKPGTVEVIESVETTHYSIVDKQGNAVSVTTTLNGMFGSKLVVKGAGFFLNNEMDDFSIKPGHPNQFGLVGAEENAIQPEKRMLSSMSPTIVEQDGDLFMVVGSPGGSTIITSVFQSILNVIDFGMSAQQAVDARKSHAQWLPDVILMERGNPDVVTLVGLVVRGHMPVIYPFFDWELGRLEVILVEEDGTLIGAPDDTRGYDDTAIGY